MIELTVKIPFEAVDAVEDCLLEHGDARWMVTQDLPSRSAAIVGVFAAPTEANAAWDLLSGALPVPTSDEPRVRTLEDRDWRDSYKAHFKATQFGRLHWVPVWERETHRIAPGEVAIWLDPGLAFGTGNHETTRLCCERLVKLAEAYPSTTPVIDAGCGSGILALSAARLGFSDVAGFDNDPEAVKVAEENAALNELAGKVRFHVGDLVSGLSGRQAGMVLANIQADVLQRFADPLISAVAPGGALILSGILAQELDAVRRTFVSLTPGWEVDSRILNEWSDLLLVRSR